jgi:hypothetical protein
MIREVTMLAMVVPGAGGPATPGINRPLPKGDGGAIKFFVTYPTSW